jgi:hypothetical protein
MFDILQPQSSTVDVLAKVSSVVHSSSSKEAPDGERFARCLSEDDEESSSRT